MAPNKCGRIALILTTFGLFAVMAALSILNKYFGKDLGIFRNSTADVSRKYPLTVTPPWPIYFIWYVVFALELVLILYGITTICRKTKSGRSIYLLSLIPPKIYGLLVVNNLAVVLWLYLWNWHYLVASLIIVVSLPVTMYLSFFISLKELFNNFAVLIQEEIRNEAWLLRFLVQNGLGFISAWQTIVMLLNLGVVLVYEIGLSDGIVALALLGVVSFLELLWLWLDVFLFDHYTRYILLPYIPPLATCCGLLWKLKDLFNNWGKLTIILFCCSILSLLCLTVKIIFLVFRHKKSTIKKDTDKTIEDKSTTKQENGREGEGKISNTIVTFAEEDEHKTEAQEREEVTEHANNHTEKTTDQDCEVHYDCVASDEQRIESSGNVIVHTDAAASSATEVIQTNPTAQDTNTILEEECNDNSYKNMECQQTQSTEGNENVIKDDLQNEEVVDDDVLRVNSVVNTTEDCKKATTSDERPDSDHIEPLAEVENEVFETNEECEVLFKENSKAKESNCQALEPATKSSEPEVKVIRDNESFNSTSVQIDDTMEDFDVDNETSPDEPELNQTPPPLVEDDEYEGTYIVNEPDPLPDEEGVFQFNRQENLLDDSPTGERLPIPPIFPTSCEPMRDYDDSDDDAQQAVASVPQEDYSIGLKSCNISNSESNISQPITTNGFNTQDQPEACSTVDTAV